MKLKESMKGKEVINDEQINNCINEVINDINSKTAYKIKDNIDWMFGQTTGTFGCTYWPKRKGNNYTITLNKQMCGEDDNAIKNVIAHELCHYIHMEEQFEKGIVYWLKPDTLKYNLDIIRKMSKGQYSSHGAKWKLIADRVSKALQLNPPITTTNTFELHNKVGEYAQSKEKYQVVCTQCGQTWNFQRATDFVKNPNRFWTYASQGPDAEKHYYNWCPHCKKGGIFKTNYNEVK